MASIGFAEKPTITPPNAAAGAGIAFDATPWERRAL